MAVFDPVLALAGGAVIGLASVLLMMLTGRIAGISGILTGCFALANGDKPWRLAFIAGLIIAPIATFRCKNDGCSIVSCARDHARSAGMIGGAGEGMLVVRMA